MATFRCRRCNYEQSEPWTEECPSCKGFYRVIKKGHDADPDDLDGYVTMGSRPRSSKYVRHSTGQESFDKVLSGGLVAGRVVLLGGFAGAGKSRLLLLTADHIGKTQGTVIYASSEESRDQLEQTAAHLGLVNDRVILMGNQRSIEKVIEAAEKTKAFLIIFDSAQKFASDYSAGTPGSGAQLKAVGEAIASHCRKTKVCSIVVNQMDKGGDLKGGTELEHHCDTVAILAYPKETDEDAPLVKDVRLLEGGKSRTGTENVKAYFRMTEEGRPESIPARSRLIVSADDDDEDDEAEPRRNKYARS